MHFQHLIKLLICGGIMTLVTSCGLKGDLYLPDDNNTQNTTARLTHTPFSPTL